MIEANHMVLKNLNAAASHAGLPEAAQSTPQTFEPSWHRLRLKVQSWFARAVPTGYEDQAGFHFGAATEAHCEGGSGHRPSHDDKAH